jgi:hypothetical protein
MKQKEHFGIWKVIKQKRRVQSAEIGNMKNCGLDINSVLIAGRSWIDKEYFRG